MQKEKMDIDNNQNYVLPSMAHSHRTFSIENPHISRHVPHYIEHQIPIQTPQMEIPSKFYISTNL